MSKPRTAELRPGEDIPLLASIPPAAWAGLVGLLLLLLGAALLWSPNARKRHDGPALAPTVPASAGESARSSIFRLPAALQAGPPRLGPALPPPAPPAPLPPLAALDRDDALRDAIDDSLWV